MNYFQKIFFLLLLTSTGNSIHAKGVYLEPSEFISSVFKGDKPALKKMWITKAIQNDIKRILDRPLGTLRLKYWSRDGRTAYILDEIGKDKPITVGLVVSGNGIEEVKILVFRESRGWEIRYPFFTDQFKGVNLVEEKFKLDKKIDGISGATLSVRAVKRLARLSLYLYRCTQANGK